MGERDRESKDERFHLGTIGALTLSVVSSVSIVICNKALMSSLSFTFGVYFSFFSNFFDNIIHSMIFF